MRADTLPGTVLTCTATNQSYVDDGPVSQLGRRVERQGSRKSLTFTQEQCAGFASKDRPRARGGGLQEQLSVEDRLLYLP